MNVTIKSITGCIHDTGFGGYPYKVIVMVQLPSKEHKTLKDDLGSLVLEVNNTVYGLNRNIPAHNPSIDSQGSKNAKNGIKIMEFVYFFQDHETALRLGFNTMKLKSGDYHPKYNDYVEILKGA